MFNLAQIGYRMTLGHPPDLHVALLKRHDLRSFYLIERLIDTGIAPERNTFWFLKIPKSEFVDKFDTLFTERIFSSFYERRLNNFYNHHIKELQIDIIHVHFAMAACKLESLKKLFGVPLITTFYGVDGSFCLRSEYWLPRLKKLFEYGDCFIVLSEVVRNRLIENGCAPDKIRIFNASVDFSFTYHPRDYNGERIRLITAARFVDKKGYPFLLQAVARLIYKGLPVELTIVGHGPDKYKIIRLIHRLKIESNIQIRDTSRVANFYLLYNELLRTHHIFVLTSTTSSNGDDEGGPALSLIAAQAAGLPVISTPVVGAERSIVDGETGLIAKENVDDFSARLEYLITNPGIWNILGRQGSDYVRQEFSVVNQTQKLVDLYREILNKGKL